MAAGRTNRAFWFAVAVLAVGAGLAAAGCGKVKSSDDKLLIVKGNGEPPPSASTHAKTESELRELGEFVELFFEGDHIAKAGLTNIFSRFAEPINNVVSGKGVSRQQLLNFLLSMDSDATGQVSVSELNDGFKKANPALRWIPPKGAITAEQLAVGLANRFPDASPAARAGLLWTLARFDEAWAGGNGDALFSREELKWAGFVIGALADTDFSEAFQLPPGASAEDRLLLELIQSKITQQMLGRYDETDLAKLPPPDLRLEWMQLFERILLANQLVQKYGAEGKIPPDRQIEALSAVESGPWERWRALLRFYDSGVAGGDGDGSLNTLEAFNLTSDLQHAKRLYQLNGNDLHPEKLVGRSYMFRYLMKLYPRVGHDLFMGGRWGRDTLEGKWVRFEYWQGLGRFDRREAGGNEDLHVDAGELTLALAHARVLDSLYFLYDANGDGRLAKTEIAPFFEKLGINDPRALELFYEGIGVDGKGTSLPAKGLNALRLFLTGHLGSTDKLAPYDFYVRMEPQMARLTN